LHFQEACSFFSITHGNSQFIEHEVGGFPADLNILGEADSRDASFVYGDKIEGGEPFNQWDFGGMKEGTRCDTGSFSTAGTFVEIVALNEVIAFFGTLWTSKSVCPPVWWRCSMQASSVAKRCCHSIRLISVCFMGKSSTFLGDNPIIP
jgi:hypothetical protein